jgi:hypothetical protein
LAVKSGTSRQWIVELEKGTAAVSFGLLMRVLDALGLVLEVLDGTPARLAMSGSVMRPPSLVARRRQGGAGPTQQQPATTEESVPSRSNRQAEPHRDAADKVSGQSYQPTDFEAFASDVSKARLYHPDYRAAIQRMVAHVIKSEGPIFEELVARRVARAHGLARATEKLQLITRELTDPTFARSSEGERTVVWPDAHAKELSPFRYASQEVREHDDIPLVELASLAASVSVAGQPTRRTAELMRREIGLKRMGENARSRFEAAAELARHLRIG